MLLSLQGLSLVAASGGYSPVVETGFSSRSTWAQLWRMGLHRMLLLPCNMWNLPGPGIKPMSPSLAGRFLSTVPPGKSKGKKDSLHCSCNFPVSFRSLKNNSKIISKARELVGKWSCLLFAIAAHR